MFDDVLIKESKRNCMNSTIFRQWVLYLKIKIQFDDLTFGISENEFFRRKKSSQLCKRSKSYEKKHN